MAALAPPAAARPLAAALRRQGCRRALRVRAAAADDKCRDKVSEARNLKGESSVLCQVNFKGADGNVLPVEMPEPYAIYYLTPLMPLTPPGASTQDMYILDAAEKAGIDLPATCRGGICGACVGRVVTGKVDMSDIDDVTFVLEQEQLDMGFALLCMSRPVPGEAVTIEAQCDWGNISLSNWKGATFFSGEPVPLWKDDVKGLRG